jgi:hypothetical protein
MKKPKESFSWTTFSDVFNTELWLALLIVYSVITIYVYFEFKFSQVSLLLNFDKVNLWFRHDLELAKTKSNNTNILTFSSV